MAIRSYFGEYEEAPEFDQGYLESIIAPAPEPAPAPAPAPAPIYQDVGQQTPQVQAAPTPEENTISVPPIEYYQNMLASGVSGGYEGPFTTKYVNWQALPGWEQFWNPASGGGDNYQEDTLKLPELYQYLDANGYTIKEESLPNDFTTRYAVDAQGNPIEGTRVTFQETGTQDLLGVISMLTPIIAPGLTSLLTPMLGAAAPIASQALISGTTAELGGGNFLSGALKGGVMAGVSPTIADAGKAVSGYVGGDLGTVLGGATTGALKSATGAVLSGNSIGDAVLSGALSGGVGAGTAALGKEYLSDLPPSVRSAVTSAVNAGILGKDPTQAAINAFLGSAMGKQAVASKQNVAEGAPMTAEQLDLDEVLHNAYGTVESRISRGQDIYSPPTEEDTTGAGAGGADLFGDFDPQLDALIYQSDLNDLLDKDTASAAEGPVDLDQQIEITGQRGDESIFGESINPFTLEELNQPIVAGPGAPITTAPAQQVEVTGQLAPAGEADFGDVLTPYTAEELAQIVSSAGTANTGTLPGQRLEITGSKPIDPYSYDDLLDLLKEDTLQTDVGNVPLGSDAAQRVEVTGARDDTGYPPYELEDFLPGTGKTDTTERTFNVTEGAVPSIEVTGSRLPPDEVAETGSAPSGGGVEEADQITRTTAPVGTGTKPATGGTSSGGKTTPGSKAPSAAQLSQVPGMTPQLAQFIQELMQTSEADLEALTMVRKEEKDEKRKVALNKLKSRKA